MTPAEKNVRLEWEAMVERAAELLGAPPWLLREVGVANYLAVKQVLRQNDHIQAMLNCYGELWSGPDAPVVVSSRLPPTDGSPAH